MINVKSAREIELMRVAGEVVAKVFQALRPMLKSGVTTEDLDLKAEAVIRANGCTPTFKGYGGFPGAICISLNDTLIHGIPSHKIVLHEGDIVSLDVGATYQGYCADACRTYPVGVTTERAMNLVKITEESFFEAMKVVKEGAKLCDISEAIQKYNESRGYSLPVEYTGHGVGKALHEDPSIPNVGKSGTGPTLLAGMTLAIEPMVAEGKPNVRTLGDGWTVKMKDGKLSSHYENTIVVTKDGYEILTTLKENLLNV
mgnify:FL=1